MAAIGSGASPVVRSYTTVQREPSWGTYPTATASMQCLEVLSNTLKIDLTSEKLDVLSVNRGFTKRVQLNKEITGTIEQHLHPEESVLLFASALGGGVVTSTITTGAYSHLLTAGNFADSISSVAFNVRKGADFTYRFTGCRANAMTISGNVGEVIKVSYDMIGKDGTQLSEDISDELSISSIAPFTFVNGTFSYSGTAECITGFELTVNNNLVSDNNARCLGSNLLSVLPATRREIEFKINQRFDTTTTLGRFLNAENAAVQLVFQSASIGSTNQYYKCTIDMPKVYQNSSDPELGGSGDILASEITYDVLVDNPHTTTGYDIKATFQNATASYG